MPTRTFKLRNSFGSALAAGALLCLLCTAGRASIINDPQMGMEDAGASNPFNSSTVLTPIDGGGVFDYYNATGNTIVGISFSVQLLPSLDAGTVESEFTCNNATTPGAANPFFLFCNPNYFPSNGVLVLSFSGLGGSHQGIPPLLPTCNNDPNNPDSTSPVDCTSQGHFVITLNTDFALTGEPSGGWSGDATPGVFADSNPQIGVQSVTSIPEPATAMTMLAALLAGAGLRRRLRRSRPS